MCRDGHRCFREDWNCARDGNAPGVFVPGAGVAQNQTVDELPRAAAMANDFARQALSLRLGAQLNYAQKALDRLFDIAMGGKGSAVQVSALREMLDQVVGRPVSPVVPVPDQKEDALAAVAALGAQLREKLDRIADTSGIETADAGTEG